MHRDGTPDEFDRDREDWEDAQQLARQALDLRAVEERHTATMNGFSSDPGTYVESAADVPALLAHCRALRVALKECREILADASLTNRVLWVDSVLAQATDE